MYVTDVAYFHNSVLSSRWDSHINIRVCYEPKDIFLRASRDLVGTDEDLNEALNNKIRRIEEYHQHINSFSFNAILKIFDLK